MVKSKDERVQLLFERLDAAPAVETADQAYGLVCDILNEIEDTHSGVPSGPRASLSDGRLYPPEEDNRFTVEGRPDLVRYRSAGHNTFFGANGAIQIEEARPPDKGRICFRKSGADGRFLEK